MINSPSGHLSGHLRSRFLDAIEDDVKGGDTDELSRAAGQVWNCTDTLPGSYCADLDIPQGSSYAQAARSVRRGS